MNRITSVEGLSVDAVKIVVYAEIDVPYILDLLGNPQQQYEEDGRFKKASGRKGNLKVSFGPGYLRLDGSPGRYTRSTNVGQCGPEGMSSFAARIASDFTVPLDAVLDAKTTRLDVALNVMVAHPVPSYFDVFGRAPYLRRNSTYPSTLYYRQSSNGRLLRLYDKLKEMMDKARSAGDRNRLRAELQELGNVIRLESQIKSAGSMFGQPVTIGDLSNEIFWPRIERHWREQFDSIQRVRGDSVSLVGPSSPTTPAKLREAYAASGIIATGGRDEAAARIRANAVDGFVTKAQSRRQIEMLDTALASVPDGPSLSDLADELDAGIERSLAVGAIWR